MLPVQNLLDTKHNKNLLLLFGLHLAVLLLLFLGLRLYLQEPLLPAEAELLRWDGEHYFSIGRHGYSGVNVAFFPLFPLVWRLLGLNAYGIVFFNIAVFFGSMAFLVRLIGLSGREVLLALSVPGFLFFYVPYTEALFFLWSVLILYAFKKESLLHLLLGLFLLSVTRSVISVFLPALLLTMLLKYRPGSRFYSLRTILLSTSAILAGVGMVALVQYRQTGEYFSFITIHATHWGHYLRWPQLPLYSWENSTRLVLLLDGAGLFVSVLCGFRLLRLVWKRMSGAMVEEEGYLVFSLFYIVGVSASIVLFQGGNIMSMNRYVFATACFVAVFQSWCSTCSFSWGRYLLVFLGLLALWLFFNSFSRLNTFLRLSVASAYFAGVLALCLERKHLQVGLFFLYYLVNTLAQAYCLSIFLKGEWVS